jgi:hypothetical protein
MGLDALQGNGITRKISYFFRDKKLVSPSEPLKKVRKSRILMFVMVQLIGFGATMAITQTKGTSEPTFHTRKIVIFLQLQLASRLSL